MVRTWTYDKHSTVTIVKEWPASGGVLSLSHRRSLAALVRVTSKPIAFQAMSAMLVVGALAAKRVNMRLDFAKSRDSGAIHFSGGVAIFTQAKGGLMYEASVGGQKFEVEMKE